MNPAITILDYLWSLRNTWLKHNDECTCSFEKLAAEHIESTLEVCDWSIVKIMGSEIPYLELKYLTAEQWSEMCGPAREEKALQFALDQHMSQVSEIMAVQATRERQTSD